MKPSKMSVQLVLKRFLEKVQDKALLALRTLLFDIYAPDKRDYPKPRVPTLSTDPNPWQARLAVAGAILFPGRITAEQFNDPVFTMFRKSGFELSVFVVRTIGTAELDC